MGSFCALEYKEGRHISNPCTSKHLILCAAVLVHSSHSGISISNLHSFDPKKHYLGGRNFMHNNNVETAVHKLYKQQQSSIILGPGKASGQVHLPVGVFSGTAFSIIFCRKSQLTKLNAAV